MKKTLYTPAVLLFLTFVTRLYYAIAVHPPESFIHSDIEIYGRISEAIMRGEWSVSHFFQPVGFPVVLAGLKKLVTYRWGFWLAVLQSLAGTLTVYFSARAAREFWGRGAMMATLVFGCIHVPWVVYTGYAMPETFYTFFLSILLLASVKIVRSEKKTIAAIIWGVGFMFAFWLKGQHAFLLPLFLAGLWLLDRRKNFVPITIISFIVVLGMGAHYAWSLNKTGVGKFSAAAGGLNFVEGKCPSKKNTDPETNITWWSPLYHSLHMTEQKKWDRPFSDSTYYMKEGVKCIMKNPWVMIQSLESVPYLFFGNTLWPVHWRPHGQKVRLYEVLFVFFAVPGLLFYFLFMARQQRLQELVVWGLPVLSLFICVYVFKSEIRYRIPFDGFIIPMALRGHALVLNAIRAKEARIVGTSPA